MSNILTKADQQQLLLAKKLLENPGLAARFSNSLGAPIEKGIELLPQSLNKQIAELSRSALIKASEAAIFTMKDAPGVLASNHWHKLGVAVSGGVGGFFGLAAIAVELPLSTSIMMRSIADVARSEGESISDVDTKMACLEVFALGGSSEDDDGTESGYFAVRTALAKSVADATSYVAKHGLSSGSAPLLLRTITRVAERFGVQVTQKAAAQAIPVIGAASGSIINTLFMDHFQAMARGHFIVRKLERQYGEQVVRALYQQL
jgi:hypothetical protein